MFDSKSLIESIERNTNAGSGGGVERVRQRFLTKQLAGGSAISITNKTIVGTVVLIALPAAERLNNPAMLFSEFWTDTKAAYMIQPRFKGKSEEEVRVAVRNVWSKLAGGYGIMEQVPAAALSAVS